MRLTPKNSYKNEKNIIKVMQIIETKTDIYLIMEYAANGELYEHIVKRKKFQNFLSFFNFLKKKDCPKTKLFIFSNKF